MPGERRREGPTTPPAGSALAGGPPHASATFVDATGAAIGWARLVVDATGRVHVNIHVKGLAPGLHGIHIHAVGACSPDFGAAGLHYRGLEPAELR